MAFAPRERVGAYQIIEQLGRGGMATVYKAYHAALDRYVAIKVLHPAFKGDANFFERFQREAQIVARLNHPHTAPVYDGKQLYIVASDGQVFALDLERKAIVWKTNPLDKDQEEK